MLPKPRPRRLEKRDAARERALAWKRLRLRAFARDGFKCRVCRTRPPYDAHHILARSLGGKDELHNLLSVCRVPCHEDIHGHVVTLRWTDDHNRAGSLRIERVAALPTNHSQASPSWAGGRLFVQDGTSAGNDADTPDS